MPNDELKVKSEKLKVSEGTSGPGLYTLLPTEEIIRIAREKGVDFGYGDPNERIRYFIKLGILPHQVRKAVNGNGGSQAHLPYSTVARLIKIDRLKKRGLSYPQIAVKIKRAEQKQAVQSSKLSVSSQSSVFSSGAFDNQNWGLLMRRLFGLFAGLTLLFGIVYGSLLTGGEKTQRFLQVLPRQSSKVIELNTSEAGPDSSGVENNAKQEQVLGVSDSKVYQSASNIVSKILRPFVNLAMVMIYGADWRVEYHFAQGEESSSAKAADDKPSVPVDISLLSELTVDGDAIIKQALTAGSLTVEGETKLGTKFTDKITIGGSFASDLVPFKTAAYNLGTGGERWKSGYFSDNVYIGDENRLGSDGMNVKGSMYLNTRSGGSIYLDADSGTVYLGEGTNKLANADNNTALTIDPSGNGKIQFHSASNFIDADGNMTIAGALTASGTTTASDDITISSTTPSLFLTDTTSGDDDYSVNAEGDTFTIRNETDSRNDISISDTGAVTVNGASAGEGTSVVTVSSGDLVLTDGDLTLSSGEVSITSDDTTTDAFTLTASSLTTGSALVLTGSSTTGVTDHFLKVTADVGASASLLNLNPDFSGSAVTGYGIYQAATDDTANANIDYGLYSSLALTGNAAKTGYGQYTTVTSTSTTADTLISNDLLTDHNAASASGNKTLYGLRSQLTNNGITDAAGTHNLYAGYFAATGNTGGTQTAYGIYATASGGDTNYAGYFQGLLNGNRTYSNTGGSVASFDATSNATTGITAYGVRNTWTNSSAVTGTANTAYGTYTTVTKTGSDSSTATTTLYGTTAVVSDSGSQNVASTRLSYGGYFSATNTDPGASSTTAAYGIYATAASADTNYGVFSTVTTASTNYALYTANGNVSNILGASDKVYINGTTTANTGTAGVLDIDITSATDNNRGIDLAYTYTNTTASTNGYGIYGAYTHSNSTNANTLYGQYFTLTDAVALGNTDFGQATVVSNTGAVGAAKTVYGQYISADNTGATSSTQNTYGSYISATGDTGGTSNAYGVYATTSGTDNAYSLFATTTSTANHYALYTANGNVSNILGASDKVYIDGSTTANTGTAGILDLDATAGNAAVDAVNIALTVNDGASLGTDMTALEILLTANDANADTFGITITAANTGNAVSGTYEAGIFINNADVTAGSMNDGILITSSGVNVGVTDAIDVSAANIDNAINAGLNDILLSTLQMNETSGGVWTVEETGGTDLIAAAAATFSINLDDTTSRTERLCHGGGDAGTGTAAVSDCSGTPGDYAEEYGTVDASIEAGDLVAADPQKSAYAIEKDGQAGSKAWVIKSGEPYQASLIGVVSTNPNEVIGRNFDLAENPRPITLNGRVPLKVSGENGPIIAGDPLTSSSTPGIAMRASKGGRVIGIALEPFDDGWGTIIAFINPSWYMGDPNFTSDESKPFDSTQDKPASEVFNVSNDTGSELTEERIKELISEEVARQIAGFISTSEESWPTSEVTNNDITSDGVDEVDGVAEATDSAALIEESQKTLDELDSLLETVNLKLETLTVNGQTQLAQTQVAGTFSQDGTLIIDYGRQINVLGSTLYLQNDPLAGCLNDPVSLRSSTSEEPELTSEVSTMGGGCKAGLLVDIGGGKLTIDKDGNLVIGGELTARGLTTKTITIDNSDAGSQSAGSGILNRGQSRVTIETRAIKESAKILITPTSQTESKILYVSQKIPFDSFTVSLDGGAGGNDITFDWLIVNEI